MRAALITFFVVVLIIPFSVTAQTWTAVDGMCDWVNSSVVYNGELVVGGRFTCAGSAQANYIAKWNGTTWTPLGSGMNGWVNALTVYNGELIAGGMFTQAGSTTVNFLAKWDGTTWTDVNGDMGSYVSALAVYNNNLIVGGYFTDADGFPANYIVGFDGNSWFNLGSGMGGSQGQVMALSIYNNTLIAGGFFTTAGGNTVNHIAAWDGTTWSPLGTGISNIVYSLGTYENELIAGGLYMTAGGIQTNSIARWNGSNWSGLGTGMGATGVGYNYVFALAEYNGSLYAGGMYATAGGVTCNGIAKWDGNSWSDLQGGVWYGGSNAYGVNTLCVYGNDLYAGGLFSTAGTIPVAHIAKWHEPATIINEEDAEKIGLTVYPNPAAGTAFIHFHLSYAATVRLSATDLMGRELLVIENKQLLPGTYDEVFNSGNLLPGYYLLKMEYGNKSRQKSFMVY